MAARYAPLDLTRAAASPAAVKAFTDPRSAGQLSASLESGAWGRLIDTAAVWSAPQRRRTARR